MTDTAISIEPLPGNARVLRRLRALQAAGEGLSPAMLDISETLQAIVERSFAGEQAPDGTPWQALTPATRKRRDRKGYTGPTLQRSRTLLDSIQADAGTDFAQVSTNLRYAAHHQFGSKPEWRHNIPARPFLGLGPGDEDEIMDIVERHFARSAG